MFPVVHSPFIESGSGDITDQFLVRGTVRPSARTIHLCLPELRTLVRRPTYSLPVVSRKAYFPRIGISHIYFKKDIPISNSTKFRVAMTGLNGMGGWRIASAASSNIWAA